MSTLTEAEKRKLLRERRQKKFANGGASSRLNKITGQSDSHLNTDSPLDNPKNEPVLESVPVAKSAPISETNEVEQPQTTTESENDPQVQLLKQLASMQNEGADSTPDLFSLLGSMQKGADGKEGVDPVMEAPVDPVLLNYHNYLVNRLKAWTILLKWIILLPYLYVITRGAETNICPSSGPLGNLCDPSNFFMIFTSFEIVATSVYYQKLQTIEKNNKVNTLDSNSKIIKIVSMVPEGLLPITNIKGKVVLLMQYWDVLSVFIGDVCLVLIAFGLLKCL